MHGTLSKNFPVMKEIDPNNEYIDLVIFDGSTNIQKAAWLLEKHNPRVTVQTCIEHTVALILAVGTMQVPCLLFA